MYGNTVNQGNACSSRGGATSKDPLRSEQARNMQTRNVMPANSHRTYPVNPDYSFIVSPDAIPTPDTLTDRDVRAVQQAAWLLIGRWSAYGDPALYRACVVAMGLRGTIGSSYSMASAYARVTICDAIASHPEFALALHHGDDAAAAALIADWNRRVGREPAGQVPLRLTADTITDEQIRELRREIVNDTDISSSATDVACKLCAIALDDGKFPHRTIRDARATCAEILNARAEVRT